MSIGISRGKKPFPVRDKPAKSFFRFMSYGQNELCGKSHFIGIKVLRTIFSGKDGIDYFFYCP